MYETITTNIMVKNVKELLLRSDYSGNIIKLYKLCM